MRQSRAMILGLGVILAFAASAPAQRNPRGKAELTLKGKTISIDYGRPSLHGRTIGQMLAMKSPTGDFWRLGADQSTTFQSGVALAFGKVAVPAGTYSLWAKKLAGNKWDLVFNKQHGQWGTSHNPKLDLYSVPLEETKASGSADMVTISLARAGDGGKLSIQWGDLLLATNFKAK